MMTIPLMGFSKTNWLNFHRHHCLSLITNRFKSIAIRNLIAAELNRQSQVIEFRMFYAGPRISLSYQASKMSSFYVEQITCSKIHLKTLQMVLQKLRKHFYPNIIQSILALMVYSLVMPAGLLTGCLLKRSLHFSSKMFQVILYMYQLRQLLECCIWFT